MVTDDANAYGAEFARFYELYLNGWIRAFAPKLASFLAGFVKPGATVIDLCCGTGETTVALRAAGWSVIGVDRSTAMLQIAREKHAKDVTAGTVRLLIADARSFEVPAAASACVCVDGALNHLDTVDELLCCFTRASAALEVDAPFVFDLLGAAHFAKWQTVTFTEDENGLFIRHGIWNSSANMALLRMTGALGSGPACWRFAETLRSRTFSAEEVTSTLLYAGFELMECALEDPRSSGRGVYCAVKRSTTLARRP